MKTEMEYKFLVDPEKWEEIEKPKPHLIVQGYIHSTKDNTVRVRIKGKKGFLTIKGKTEGISRSEFEYEIPLNDAEELIKNFTPRHLRKERYDIKFAGKKWEVDVFHDKLEGLIIAELEVQSLEETFNLPDWVTKDVSNDPAYFNAVLIENC